MGFMSRVYDRVLRPIVPVAIDEELVLWRTVGYLPNVWRPQTFNEKIAHRRLFTNDPLFSVLADKWRVRDYVKEKVGQQYLTNVYHLFREPDEISTFPLEELPRSFVAKGTHDSGSALVVRDKDAIDPEELRQRFLAILTRRLPPRYSYWYRKIPPGLLIEELLEDERHNVPLDFKISVFHGKARFIQVFHDRRVGGIEPPRLRFYTPTWEPIPVRRPNMELAPLIERPKPLPLMLEIAETLAEDLDYVRVDLYCVNDSRIVFGELTLAPGWRPFEPRDYDWKFGAYW